MIHTLDIILFSGADWWPSRLIEWICDSKFSHVAVGVLDPIYIDASLRGEYMVESGEEFYPDAVSEEMRWGVQMQEWQNIIRSYNGRVYRRRFEWLSGEPIENLDHLLKELWQKTHDASYDLNPIDFIEAQFQVKIFNRQTKEFVCSAYAACCLCFAGVIPSNVNWNMFMPRDFKEGGRIDRLLNEKGLGKLGPVERLK